MFTPAPGCVLIKSFESDSVVQSVNRNYDRIGEVIGVPEKNTTTADIGDIVFFDEYAYRRFTYKDQDYCVVDISHDGLWGIIKKDATDTQGSPVPQEGISAPIPSVADVPDGRGGDVPAM